MFGWLAKMCGRKKEPAFSLDDGTWVEFVADGRTHRVDPFIVIDDLVRMDQEHNRDDGGPMTREFLADVAAYVRDLCQIKTVTHAGAFTFYQAVVAAYGGMTETLQKKTSQWRESRIGSESIRRNGQLENATRG